MRALQQFRSGRSRAAMALGVGAAVCVGAAGYADAASGPARPTATPDSPTGLYANGASLVSGRLVKPAGVVRALGDFPVASVVSPDGALAVVVNSGEGQGGTDQGNESLQVVRLRDNAVVQTFTDHQPGQPTFYNKPDQPQGAGRSTLADQAARSEQEHDRQGLDRPQPQAVESRHVQGQQRSALRGQAR